MPLVISNNSTLQIMIEKLIRVLQENGAFVHPELIVRVKDEGLCVGLAKQFKGDALITLKREHLIDLSLLDVTVIDGRFDYNINPNVKLSTLQTQLIESMFAIYNESKRWEHFKKSFPILNAGTSVSYRCYELLLSARKLKKEKNLSATTYQKGYFSPQFLAKLFLKTRVYGYKTSDGELRSVLMPLVDFLNHDWDGVAFEQKTLADDSILTIHAKQLKGADECFVFYGPMDSLDSYLEYGFVDKNSPVVRSIPVTINIENFGILEFQSKSIEMFGNKLDKNLRGLNKHLPQFLVSEDKRRLQASHLFIPSEHSPFSMRKILLNLLQEMLTSKAAIDDLMPYVLKIEDEILDKNRVFYHDLKKEINLLEEENGDSSSEINIAKQIVGLQLLKIENYNQLRQGFKTSHLTFYT